MHSDSRLTETLYCTQIVAHEPQPLSRVNTHPRVYAPMLLRGLDFTRIRSIRACAPRRLCIHAYISKNRFLCQPFYARAFVPFPDPERLPWSIDSYRDAPHDESTPFCTMQKNCKPQN